MKVLLILLLLPILSVGQTTPDIQLPPPQIKGGKPLMEALLDRHSSREFSSEKLDLQTLSNLLWAADGYNRPEEKKRTAPNSMDYQEIDIYLALPGGLYLWDPLKNILKKVLDTDLRANTGKQDFVKDAAVNLIYVADYAKVKGGKTEDRLRASFANTGFIAENVYLFCASAGLNTIIRGYFDGTELAKLMNLRSEQQVTLCQTVGKPIKIK